MKLSLYRHARRAAALVALALFALATPVGAASDSLATLRKQDDRLLSVSEQLLSRNVALCDRTMPALGVALQSTDQYPSGGQPPFSAAVGFAAVLPGSAAALAGIARDDGLVAINGRAIEKLPALAAAPLRDSAFAQIADHPAQTPLVLGIVRAGVRRDVTLTVGRECRALVEVLADKGTDARSDGKVIQIAYGLVQRVDDRELAAIVAHELAHSILHHRDRLSAADVKKGLLGEFGRNKRLNRQAEVEADRLSVYLLANAGIDPKAAPAFWRSKLGKRLSGGIFHDAAHPGADARAQMLDSEIAARAAAGGPAYPAGLLADRTRPLG
jgi:hypothetical protein